MNSVTSYISAEAEICFLMEPNAVFILRCPPIITHELFPGAAKNGGIVQGILRISVPRVDSFLGPRARVFGAAPQGSVEAFWSRAVGGNILPSLHAAPVAV
jgi:hypothetical protein